MVEPLYAYIAGCTVSTPWRPKDFAGDTPTHLDLHLIYRNRFQSRLVFALLFLGREGPPWNDSRIPISAEQKSSESQAVDGNNNRDQSRCDMDPDVGGSEGVEENAGY